ncbi:MAG TPA: hypothetical protein PLI34_02770 [Saprospiraceae bacterium]|mgnify:FL=1|nr:hypothetical protein [Saprospiraceae bacterium]
MQMNIRVRLLSITLIAVSLVLSNCPPPQTEASQEHFLEDKDKQHNGDYFATYPLHSPDSCIIRLKAEVPPRHQPWGCMAIWYRMPRSNRDSSFRMLELYERHYPHDTVHTFSQIKRAEFYVDAAQFHEADSCLQDVEQAALRLQRILDLSDVYFLRGRMEVYRNNFSEARQVLFKYLELLDSRDTSFSQEHALGYMSIAASYERSQQFEKSREWFDKVLNAPGDNISEDWLDKLKAQAAINVGIGYLGTNPDSGLIWAQIAEKRVKEVLKLPSPHRLSYLFGRAHVELAHCDVALPYLLDAYHRRPGSHEVFGYYQYPLALGHLYLCTGRLDSAEILLRESLPSPDTGNLSATYRMLGEVAARRGDYQSAWEHQKTSTHLLRAKFTADRIMAAAETDARYDALEQSKRVAVLEKEHQLNRQKIWLLLALLTLLISVAVALHHRERRRQKMLHQQKQLIEQEKLLAELRAQLKEQELEQSQVELQQTKDELDEAAALLELKNQLIETLELRWQKHLTSEDTDIDADKISEGTFSEMRILTKEDWSLFLEKFSEQFPHFLQRIQHLHPDLTAAETRLLLLLKIGFDTRQMAGMLGIADNSIWRSRHRLVKKLGLDSAKELGGYISSL